MGTYVSSQNCHQKFLELQVVKYGTVPVHYVREYVEIETYQDTTPPGVDFDALHKKQCRGSEWDSDLDIFGLVPCCLRKA